MIMQWKLLVSWCDVTSIWRIRQEKAIISWTKEQKLQCKETFWGMFTTVFLFNSYKPLITSQFFIFMQCVMMIRIVHMSFLWKHSTTFRLNTLIILLQVIITVEKCDNLVLLSLFLSGFEMAVEIGAGVETYLAAIVSKCCPSQWQ